MTISPEPVWLPDVIAEQVALMEPLAADRGVTLQATAAPTCAVHVVADRIRIKQVLINLLSNAMKYNRPGGSVSVGCRLGTPGRILIDVVDTGPGISGELLDRLFTPFDRLGAEATGIEGTGIGLALTRRLLEHMNGTISATSVVGTGSTFTVDLAIADESAAPTTWPTPPAPPSIADRAGADRAATTVLLIDDNPANVGLVEQLVRRRPGIALITALQGRIGLDLARRHRPALILLDLHLPDVNGAEILAALRADPETAAIPVIIVTADATPGQIERLKAAGATEYLSKPLDVGAFLKLLDGVVPTP